MVNIVVHGTQDSLYVHGLCVFITCLLIFSIKGNVLWVCACLGGFTVCANDMDVVVFFKRLYLTLTMRCMYNTVYGCFYKANILEVYEGGG